MRRLTFLVAASLLVALFGGASANADGGNSGDGECGNPPTLSDCVPIVGETLDGWVTTAGETVDLWVTFAGDLVTTAGETVDSTATFAGDTLAWVINYALEGHHGAAGMSIECVEDPSSPGHGVCAVFVHGDIYETFTY